MSRSLSGIFGTLLGLLVFTDQRLDRVMFESVSAFATVGLSTGITGDLPGVGPRLALG